MKIKKINENWADDLAEAGRRNAIAFGFKERTYTDNVFSHWKIIIANENGISEKAFSMWDKMDELQKEFVRNHPEIFKITKEYENKNLRHEFCAEYLYSIYKELEKNII